MKDQDVTPPLSQEELICLRKILEHGDNFSHSDLQHELSRLMELELIEKAPSFWLPLEMKHDVYQLTSLGQQVLSSYE